MRLLLGGLMLLASSSFAAAQSPAEQRGEELFNRCSVCHSVEPGVHRVGPSLAGVFGRAAGTEEGFRYSPAMTDFGAAGVAWDEDTLDAFLAAPRGLIRGTRMTFPGIRDDDDRAAVIAYLRSLSER